MIWLNRFTDIKVYIINNPFIYTPGKKTRFKRHSTDKICEYNWICISIVVWLLCKYDIEWFLVSLISFLFLWWISFKIQAFLCTQSCHFSTTHFRSKMRMVLKPHICNTMSTETEHVKLHKGGSCCRTLLWNRIKFVLVQPMNQQRVCALVSLRRADCFLYLPLWVMSNIRWK